MDNWIPLFRGINMKTAAILLQQLFVEIMNALMYVLKEGMEVYSSFFVGCEGKGRIVKVVEQKRLSCTDISMDVEPSWDGNSI